MARLELRGINKIYPNGEHIIKDVNLTLNDGEFTVFVGPSGCGKSTMLRMIAGLEEITSGEMLLDGEVVNDISPKERGIGMVFQSYALYPHMSVYDNIAFGLKFSTLSKQEITRAIHNVAEMLELTALLKQKPGQLSGGQRQRVAIGRAIVRNPSLFLLDEPLSNLDASLRVRMRLQLAEYHKKLKSTVIYVTHDQIEAMTLADNIVVLRNGKIEQTGSPLELYYFPATLFVAGFIGSPKMNLLPATLISATEQQACVEVGDYTFKADVNAIGAAAGALMTIGIRPEDIHLAEQGVGVIVEGLERLGTESLLYTTLVRGGQEVLVRVPGTVHVEVGQRLNIRIPAEKCHLFDRTGKAYIRGTTLSQLITLPPEAAKFKVSIN
ncbi:ABC transporter ATP-binding protein [Enterobacter cloacae complex sp. 2024EL-00215]|uniref:ABC transporter ATP-binding protein n=1 Tax=unclassified Enterobacter cloacae complex TaxID=2757714 RepID=UPI003753693B